MFQQSLWRGKATKHSEPVSTLYCENSLVLGAHSKPAGSFYTVFHCTPGKLWKCYRNELQIGIWPSAKIPLSLSLLFYQHFFFHLHLMCFE